MRASKLKPLCRVVRCDGPSYSRKLCRPHYAKIIRVGAVCFYCGASMDAGEYCSPEHAVLATENGRSIALRLLDQEIEALREEMLGTKFSGRLRLLQLILRAAR